MQQEDFVLGIKIELSNNHTLNGKPFTDICDELQGKYPKDFKFTGWHPFCRCHAITILPTTKEIIDHRKNGTPYNYVKDTPKQFKQWIEENTERMQRSKSLPYFVRDNEKYFPQMTITNQAMKGVKEEQKFNEKIEKITKLTPLEIAEQRHAQRTPEQIADIQRRANERQKRLKEYSLLQKRSESVLKASKEYNTDVDYEKLNSLLSSSKQKPFYSNSEMEMLKQEMQSTAKQIQEQRALEKSLSDIIPDVHQWHKKFTINELNNVYDSVSAKLSEWENLSVDERCKKLEFEAIKYLGGNMNGVQKKYNTWEVSQMAYLKQLKSTSEKWMFDSINSGFISNSSTASDYYASAILTYSSKNYKYQKSVLSKTLEKQATINLNKYLKETPINPHYVFGEKIGGVYQIKNQERKLLALELNNVTEDELSLVTRFTDGMTFYNSYNLRNKSLYWKGIWESKMSNLSANEISECERRIKEYTIALDGIINKMKRYDGIVFRGVHGKGASELIEQFNKAWNGNKKWKNYASASSSTNPLVARAFYRFK